MRDGPTTREDRATQLLIYEKLSLFFKILTDLPTILSNFVATNVYALFNGPVEKVYKKGAGVQTFSYVMSSISEFNDICRIITTSSSPILCMLPSRTAPVLPSLCSTSSSFGEGGGKLSCRGGEQ